MPHPLPSLDLLFLIPTSFPIFPSSPSPRLQELIHDFSIGMVSTLYFKVADGVCPENVGVTIIWELDPNLKYTEILAMSQTRNYNEVHVPVQNFAFISYIYSFFFFFFIFCLAKRVWLATQSMSPKSTPDLVFFLFFLFLLLFLLFLFLLLLTWVFFLLLLTCYSPSFPFFSSSFWLSLPPPPLPPAFCMTVATAMCHVFHKQENGFVTTARIIP